MNTWTTKHPYQLTTAPAIIRNRNHIAQRRVVGIADLIEEVYEVVGCAAAGEDDDAFAC